MRSCPTGATLHRFLCGVAPVGQVEVEGIWAFHTGNNGNGRKQWSTLILELNLKFFFILFIYAMYIKLMHLHILR